MEVPPLTEPVGVAPPSPKVSQSRPDVRHPLAQVRADLADLERQRRAATSSRAAALITSAIHERYAEAGLLARASGLASRFKAPVATPQDTRRSA